MTETEQKQDAQQVTFDLASLSDRVIERAFIVGLLKDFDKMLYVLPICPPDALTDFRYAAVYKGLEHLWRYEGQMSGVLLADTLVTQKQYEQIGGRAFLEALFDSKAQADPERLAERLLDFYRRRKEIEFCDRVAQRAFDRSQELSERSKRLHEGTVELARIEVSQGGGASWQMRKQMRHQYYQRQEETKGRPRINWPFAKLRAELPGLEDGELISFVGDEGSGKTTLFEQFSEYWWQQGWKVVLYHPETSPTKMENRLTARYTGIPLKVLQDNVHPDVYLTDEQYALIRQMEAMLDSWPGDLTLVHCPGWTMEQICLDYRQRCEVDGSKILALDYFDKVRLIRGANESKTNAIEDALELYKSTLEQTHSIGLIGAQFDKGSKNSKGRSVVDARNSGAILSDKSQWAFVLERLVDEDQAGRTGGANLRMSKGNDAARWVTVNLVLVGGRYYFEETEGEFPF